MSVRDREESVVARLHALSPSLGGEPDPDFRAATRARLVAMAAVRTPEPAPRSTLQRLLSARAADAAPARWRGRLTAGLAGAALTVTALASLVAVADDARPGDVLYDLKRGTEQTQLALAGDSRGQTLLDFASTRLDELETLVGDGPSALPAVPAGGQDDATVLAADADPALVLETLRTMDEQTQEGAAWLTDRAVDTANRAPLDRLAQWAAAQSGELAALEPLVPEAAADAVAGSLELLAQVGLRADGLEVALSCAGGPAVAGTDDLGPVPAACPTPVETPGAPTSGQTPGPGSVPAPAPQGTTPPGTTPAQPTVPPEPAPAPVPPGGGTGGLPTTVVPAPTTPRLPTPSGPQLPLPVPPAPSSAIVSVPPLGPIEVCIPPLLTVGC
ncbi:DUF5667 domain-containing protein [Blastococcus haudaquaticus]|uniref:DUF5667 domain-containing protein n=1 Tax=Blastococcus haudaquaticus TaxID=1938745 RepID=A0A286GGP9_9ACTN|nr:DUF5667 domain-containing protein [Blastococcus haudaquaticus]SOD94299.1 hypothetical protein SAMN06272739_0688 [Blastococcus haudaquaticus]